MDGCNNSMCKVGVTSVVFKGFKEADIILVRIGSIESPKSYIKLIVNESMDEVFLLINNCLRITFEKKAHDK